MVDLNFDLKDLFKKKPASGKDGEAAPVDRTVIKRVVIGILLAAIVFGCYYFFLKPQLGKQEAQIKQMANWKTQMQSCMLEIKKLEQNLDNLNNESSLKSGLFVSDDEFENFYAELTEATINNNLRIINITRGEEIPVRLTQDQVSNSSYNYNSSSQTIPCEKGATAQIKQAKGFQKDPDCKGEDCGPIAYYKMTVTYEIEGSFGQYVQFRNILANKEKIVNIESELISKGQFTDGRVLATATVSLVKNVE